MELLLIIKLIIIDLIINMQKIEIGKMGEDIAAKFLIKRGYRFIERNYRQKFGEIDLIFLDPAGTLVFIEVKAIQIGERGVLKPEDNITTRKLKIVNRMGQYFSASHPELVDDEKGWRVDLIAIDISQNKKYSLRHYKNLHGF